MLYNPYRNYDKGMDDAYMGYEPQMTSSLQYMVGYEFAKELLSSEQNDAVCDATEADSNTEAGNKKTPSL